jgi:GNAT superfamily N-acetyltransferase
MVQIGIGLAESHRSQAAALYYDAFRQKLHPIFRNEQRAIRLLADAINGDYALVATLDGQLAGIAGFKDANGSMTDIQPSMMTDSFGFLGGWWRLLALSIFERKLEPGVLLMDGIVVDASMRGRGVGSLLLDAMLEHARGAGYRQVRLDVVDTNPRARQLYERKGFVAASTETYPLIKHIFGFSGSTTMYKQVSEGA